MDEAPGPATAEFREMDDALKAELELGSLLFSAGTPGQRILDSIDYLNGKLAKGRHQVLLGFETLTIALEGGGIRRVGMQQYPMPTAMNGTAQVRISRYLHAIGDTVDPAGVLRDLRSLDIRSRYPFVLTIGSLILFTAIFGYFNRADAWALLIISFAALLAGLTKELMMRHGENYYLSVLAATLAATISAAALSMVVPTGTPLVSLVIPCVFLIPGFQMINSGWEILRNHMQIGIPRLMVFLNVLAIMSIGLLAVLLVYTPGPDGPGITLSPGPALIIGTLLGGAAAVCYCILIKAPKETFLACLLCGAVARLVRILVVDAGGDIYLGVFCGAVALAVLAVFLCELWQIPWVIPLIAASVQFIPGYYFIITLRGMARIIQLGSSVPYDIVASTLSTGLLTLFISVSIIMGTLLPVLIAGRNKRFY